MGEALLPEAESYVESAMGKVAKGRFLPGPVQSLDIPSDQDLIASAATVQWVEDQPALLKQLAEALAPKGWLLLSSFGPAHFSELQSLGHAHLSEQFRDPAGWRAILPATLKPVSVQVETHVLTLKSPHSVLMHLRDTGVNGSAGQQWTKSRLRQFEQDYADKFGAEHGVTLTFQPVYVIARKD